MQTWQFAAVLVRFAAAAMVIQAVVGMFGTVGFVRRGGEVPVGVALGALFLLVFGVALWRVAAGIGRLMASGLE